MSPFKAAGRLWYAIPFIIVIAVLPLVAGRLPGNVRQVLKIGLVAPFEGPERTMAYDALFAVRLAVRRYNQAPGQSGPLVELVALNDDGQPDESRQQADEMGVDPDILGVIGPWSAATAQAAVGTYRAAGLALVLPDAGSARLLASAASDGVVEIAAGDDIVAGQAAEWAAKTRGARRIALVRGDDDLADRFRAALSGLSLAVVADLPAPGDRSALVDALAAARPDLVFLTGDGVEAAGLVQEMRRQGMSLPVLLGPGADRLAYLQMAGEAVADTTVLAVAPTWPEIAGQDFVEGFRALAGKEPGTQAILAYDAANVLLKTIRQVSLAGSPTRAAISAGLKSTRWTGLTGAVQFDDRGERLGAPIWLRPLATEFGVRP